MRYKDFAVTGIASDVVLDSGLVSTEIETVRIEAILICVELYAGNHIEGWIGTKKFVDIIDYVFDTFDIAAADTPYPATAKIGRLPIEEDLPAGQSFKIGIRCGLTDTDIYGAYEYKIIGA